MYKHLRSSGRLTTLGLDIVLSVVFGFLGGRWLDGHFELAPALTLLGTLFGIVAAGRFVYQGIDKMRTETAEDGFDGRGLDRPARYKLRQERQR